MYQALSGSFNGAAVGVANATKTDDFATYGVLLCGEGVGDEGGGQVKMEWNEGTCITPLAAVELDVAETKQGVFASRSGMLTRAH
jgi:hypothetical protein